MVEHMSGLGTVSGEVSRGSASCLALPPHKATSPIPPALLPRVRPTAAWRPWSSQPRTTTSASTACVTELPSPRQRHTRAWGSLAAPSTLDAVVLHWSPLPTSSPLFTGASLERLSWAWPSPRLVKLEVLTLELLFLLAAPHTPQRPPGTRTGPDQTGSHLSRCGGYGAGFRCPGGKGKPATDSPGPAILASLPASATSRGLDGTLRLGWTHASVEG